MKVARWASQLVVPMEMMTADPMAGRMVECLAALLVAMTVVLMVGY